MTEQQSMLVITSTWGNPPEPTLRLIPIYENCPYQECIYDPGSKVLAVISKIPMKKMTMIPKLDGAGNRLVEFDKKDKNKAIGFKQERIQIDSYQEYYIEKEDEIRDFIWRFAVNTFDIEPYLQKEPLTMTPAQSEDQSAGQEEDLNTENINQ